MREEQSDLAQMVRLALAEQSEDVRLFTARLVRKYRGTAPDLAEQLELFLKSKPVRSVSHAQAVASAANGPRLAG